MVSVLRSAAPLHQPLAEASPKAKLKTILGRSSQPKAVDPSAVQRSPALERSHPSLSRRSIDTITDWQVKQKKSKADRPSTPDISFFEQDVVTVTKPSDIPDNEMKNGIAPRPSQRRPLRIDGQDGPWAISVAENDPSSYSLYVKSESCYVHPIPGTPVERGMLRRSGPVKYPISHALASRLCLSLKQSTNDVHPLLSSSYT